MQRIEAIAVRSDELLGRTRELKRNGWRLIGITVVPGDKEYDVLYHFDRDLTLRHLRLNVVAHATLPSICPVYAAAFVAENEVRDQFGLRFRDLVPDYGKTFFLEEGVAATPLCPGAVAKIEKKESSGS